MLSDGLLSFILHPDKFKWPIAVVPTPDIRRFSTSSVKLSDMSNAHQEFKKQRYVAVTRRDWFNQFGEQMRVLYEAQHGLSGSENVSAIHNPHLHGPGHTTARTGKPNTSGMRQEPTCCTLPKELLLPLEQCQETLSSTTSKIAPVERVDADPPESLRVEALTHNLLSQYSQTAHMALTDKRYKLFISPGRHGGICYRFHENVAVICGDPLCKLESFSRLLADFRLQFGLSETNIVFLGISRAFKVYADRNRWISIDIGVERIITPLTNPILLGVCSKRIYAQVRQLLDSKRGGIELEIYNPRIARNMRAESEMKDIYNSWRTLRQRSSKPQSYLTILDFGTYPGVLFYICAKDPNGRLCGFAGLRRLGADRGYHLDPCIEAVWAKRGVADLLSVASMALLKSLSMSDLSLGFEPTTDSSVMSMSTGKPLGPLRSLQRNISQLLQLEGKKKHNDRLKPDDSKNAQLYVVFPVVTFPRPQQLFALMGSVHMDVRHVMRSYFKCW